MRRLLAALEILHAHAQGPFADRLFQASRLLFADSFHSFELYHRADGTHTAATNAPFDQRRRAEIIARIGELVPVEHPAFPHMARGETAPLRVSDLMALRRFRETALYREILRDVEAKFQIILPIGTAEHAGALTINRGTADYSDAEMALAAHFAPHLLAAYETDLLLRTTASSTAPSPTATDFTPLRRTGLSHRESEILWWIGQGKRDAEIAQLLGISSRTVHHHVHAILRKLGVETRTAALAFLSRLSER